ncbi:hypothetical protein [Nocardia seriolae]|uniref:DNA-directed RNA polymerase subunit beta n=1 Tax=Nocardia seriolae TaxID=37332 RepID=A0A0B8MZR6_9NOCA|nr:hypothetical protein [Nocardia seriolae]APA94679.1 hypothetical protein NS506_00597 [Nocardia seriolae]MTJ66999.1 hypothetical protein [Nocardia seriolae]MTJ70046.1 hypothetical protein [Nocardia seriolae]MTJ84978.1 hypothetical protein [Nocardia seriolae]MTK28974.1 hypothetical protein [Nocardia seriolae]
MSALDPSSYTATQEALARCRRYRKEHGLYGVVDSALGRIMLEVGAVGAVTMPADLGRRVRDRLSAQQRCGPIIAHPRSGRWTFLTGPMDDSYLDMTLFSDLFRDCASVALPGSNIVLPSPSDEHNGYRAWIHPPEGDFRPELADVLAATRECRPVSG